MRKRPGYGVRTLPRTRITSIATPVRICVLRKPSWWPAFRIQRISDGVAGIVTMNIAPYIMERSGPEKNGCLIWKGSPNSTGYGQCRRKGTWQYAHRLSFQLHIGEIPKGMMVLHKCDNPMCVNPEHLILGTQKDNMQDCSRKGRNTRLFGKSNGMYRHGKYINRAP